MLTGLLVVSTCTQHSWGQRRITAACVHACAAQQTVSSSLACLLHGSTFSTTPPVRRVAHATHGPILLAHVALLPHAAAAALAAIACCRWVGQLEEEFFRQGDVERTSGMTISPLFDRSKQGITKSQVGFFDIVIIPLFHTFSKVFGNCKPLLTYVMRNYRYW